MDRKIVFGIIAFVILAIGASILLPGGKKVEENPRLPWMIDVDIDGKTEALGIKLNHSTLYDAQLNFNQEPEVTLFRSPEGKMVIEAFFNRIFLSGLKANIVLSMDVSQEDAEAMFDRGLRISQMGDGSKKVDLSEVDIQTLLKTPFSSMTYLPAANLEPDLVESRFGVPSQKVAETETIEHWLYPSKGLDIAVNADGKEVFQFVLPKNFDKVMEPLKAAQQ